MAAKEVDQRAGAGEICAGSTHVTRRSKVASPLLAAGIAKL